MTPITLIAILIMSGAIMIYLYVKFIDFLVKYRDKQKRKTDDIFRLLRMPPLTKETYEQSIARSERRNNEKQNQKR